MEGRIYAPKPVRHSLTAILSQRQAIHNPLCPNKTVNEDTKQANDEILQILGQKFGTSRKQGQTGSKTPSPSFRSLGNLSTPPSRELCKKPPLEEIEFMTMSTSESTDSL